MKTKRGKKVKIKHRIFYDVKSHALHEHKHHEIMEQLAYEVRKQNLIYLIILLFGVALGVVITVTVLKLLIVRFV